MKNEDFAHAVARIRVLEGQLLSENEVERMLLANNAQEAYKVLNDLDYSSHIGDIEDVVNFQEVINAGLKDAKELIVKITPHKWVFDVLWFRYDFHNIKTLIKGKVSGKEYKEIEKFMMPFGAIEIDKLKAMIFDKEDVSFKLKVEHEVAVKTAIKMALEVFAKTQDPQLTDVFLDRSFCELSLIIAKESENDFIITLVRKYIDLHNIESFIRIKARNGDEKLLEAALVVGGTLEKYRFIEAFKKELSDFSETLSFSDYSNVIKAGVEGLQQEKSFSPLDKASYDHLTDYIQPAKRIAFGPAAIIGYFWAKKNNALIIRTVMVSKLNGFEPEEIRSKLRTLYIA